MRASRMLAALALLGFHAARAAEGDAPIQHLPDLAQPEPRRSVAAWRFELKHTMTNRGAIDERTKVIARVEKLLDGPVSLLRVDLPYVDKNNQFAMDLANAGFGDVECRVGARPVRWGSTAVVLPFLDATFPTAATSRTGSGKWLLGPAVSLGVNLPAPWAAGPTLSFQPQLQQYFSVAGDPARPDIDYTGAELKLEAEWKDVALVNVNPKPVLDWTSGVRTACVLDVQGIWLVTRLIRLSVRSGFRLWGEALPSTYDQQLEVAVRLTL